MVERSFRGVLKIALVWSACLSFVIADAASVEKYPTGLVPAPKERLNLIPIATPPPDVTPTPSISFRDSMPPPGDQRPLHSCAAWAAAYALKSFQEGQRRHWSLKDSSGNRQIDHTFNPSFIYNRTNEGKDNGASLLRTLEVLSQYGCPSMKMMPFKSDDYTSKGDDTVEREAMKYQLHTFYRINHDNLGEIKRFLLKACPILIAANVDNSFMDLQKGDTWSSFSGAQRWPHAMLVTGFDDTRQAFEVENSWGENWADNGFGWIDYTQFQAAVFEAYFALSAPPNPPVDPLFAVGRIWTDLVNLGKLSQKPSIQEIKQVGPSKKFLPAYDDRREGVYKLIQANWDEFRMLSLLPGVKAWGKATEQDLGNAQRFVFSPTFNSAVGHFREVPKDITVWVDLTNDGTFGGFQYQGEIHFEYDFPAAVPGFLQKYVQNENQLTLNGISRTENALASNRVEFQPPIVQPIPSGLMVSPRGFVHAFGTQAQLQVTVLDSYGNRLWTAPVMERSYGTTLYNQVQPGPLEFDLAGSGIVIPLPNKLGFPFRNYSVKYDAWFILTVFLDGKVLRSTQPYEFSFWW